MSVEIITVDPDRPPNPLSGLPESHSEEWLVNGAPPETSHSHSQRQRTTPPPTPEVIVIVNKPDSTEPETDATSNNSDDIQDDDRTVTPATSGITISNSTSNSNSNTTTENPNGRPNGTYTPPSSSTSSSTTPPPLPLAPDNSNSTTDPPRTHHRRSSSRKTAVAVPHSESYEQLGLGPGPESSTLGRSIRVGVDDADERGDDSFNGAGMVHDYESSLEVERVLAFPARAVNLRRASPSQEWRYSKVFQDGRFIASGQLSIPPSHDKPVKSVKDNTYIFYVVDGSVRVQIHSKVIELSRGGMFMVPRGNTYSIRNTSPSTPAHLFFCQAREVPATELDDPLRLGTSLSLSTSRLAPSLYHSKMAFLLGWLLERLMKQAAKYREVWVRWYLRTSFRVAGHLREPRAYVVCVLVGFLLRSLPWFGRGRINIQLIRGS